MKAYDKAGSILRIETTINDVKPFQSYRASESDQKSEVKWRPMRKGVADMKRRSEVSQSSNDRYAEALSAVETGRTIGEWATELSKGSSSY